MKMFQVLLLRGFLKAQLWDGFREGWNMGQGHWVADLFSDPRQKDMKDKVNMAIKFRESFRPFAPTILSEFGAEYFEDFIDSPFMTLNFKARKEKSHLIPAVVHVD